ncbi:MAG TPA: hypothetical protein VHQ01_09105 [Pyrinomonadaceae bacterium]|nr:hypothetical protein [Pyrinomonadaceae bacterium]
MKKQLSDEQLDQMMRQLVSDAALDDVTVNEVADSPTLWWAIQRQINRQKEVSVEPWPPIAKFWRWLILGVPAATAAVVLAVLFAFQPSRVDTDDLALTVAKVSDEVVNVQPQPNVTDPAPVKIDNGSAIPVDSSPVALKFVAAKHIENRSMQANRVARTSTVARKAAEIKTDFIALSYARNPDSGQIVRVRVPSSMMVTLGLVDSVEKPSNLVDAEVLVGDDGLTRAIRFIR